METYYHNQAKNNEQKKPPDINQVETNKDSNNVSNKITMAKLLLTANIFEDRIFDDIKNNESIESLDDLVEEMCKNKEGIKKILCETILNKPKPNEEKVKEKNNDVTQNNSSGGEKTYASVAKKNMTNLEFKKNKVLIMQKEELSSFLDGKLVNRDIMENSFHHTTLYYKFQNRGNRNVTQVKSFLMSVGIPLHYVSNIHLINEDILEISCLKGYREIIDGKLTQHLKLVGNIDAIFKKGLKKDELLRILPTSIEEYVEKNSSTIKRLEELHMKIGYRKYLAIINNKIKNIVAINILEDEKAEEIMETEKRGVKRTNDSIEEKESPRNGDNIVDSMNIEYDQYMNDQ